MAHGRGMRLASVQLGHGLSLPVPGNGFWQRRLMRFVFKHNLSRSKFAFSPFAVVVAPALALVLVSLVFWVAVGRAAPVGGGHAPVHTGCHLVPPSFIQTAHARLPPYLLNQDLSGYRDFLRAGGQGELYFLGYADAEGNQVNTLYMRVDRAPTAPLADADFIGLRDGRFLEMWQKKLDAGVAFVITDKYKDFSGEVSYAGVPAYALQQSCIFKNHPSAIVELTPDASVYIFIHEFQHYNDNLYGRFKAIDQALRPLAQALILYPPAAGGADEVFAFKRFILEQRAYATEMRALRKQETVANAEFFRGRPDPTKLRNETDKIQIIPFKNLEAYEIYHIRSTLRTWAMPVSQVLARVSATETNNPGNLELVKSVLRHYCSPSDDVGLHQVLPQYF